MAKVSEITEPYFSHDISTRCDEKILKMLFGFRKTAKEMSREELESFVPLAAYGIFWAIVEYMHRNFLSLDDTDVLADDLRISEKFIKMILNDYDLFRQDDGKYISDRILRNINKQEEKSNSRAKAAKAKWILSSLKSYCKEILKIDLILEDSEKAKFLKYSERIENFKELLPDILYTVKHLKFDNNPDFNPSINWLLTDNHLTKLLNGEYGKLKSWSNHLAALKKLEAEKQAEEQQEETVESYIHIQSKVVALDILSSKCNFFQRKIIGLGDPRLSELKNRFDITDEELKNAINEKNKGEINV